MVYCRMKIGITSVHTTCEWYPICHEGRSIKCGIHSAIQSKSIPFMLLIDGLPSCPEAIQSCMIAAWTHALHTQATIKTIHIALFVENLTAVMKNLVVNTHICLSLLASKDSFRIRKPFKSLDTVLDTCHLQMQSMMYSTPCFTRICCRSM